MSNEIRPDANELCWLDKPDISEAVRGNVLSIRRLDVERHRPDSLPADILTVSRPPDAKQLPEPISKPIPEPISEPISNPISKPISEPIPKPQIDAAALATIPLPPMLPLARRLGKYRWLDHYKRLLLIVIVANLAVLAAAHGSWQWFDNSAAALSGLSQMVLINLSIAVLIRQQLVVNLLFRIATSLPLRWPLALRSQFGKVYHFGGLHSGCACAATLWFVLLTGWMIKDRLTGAPSVPDAVLLCTVVLALLLVGIVAMAMPGPRARFHDTFEIVHRFGGWTSLLLFWLQTVLLVDMARGDTPLLQALLTSGTIAMLCVLTASIILPWLRLRRVKVDITRPSTHVALTQFDYGVTPFAGSATTISRRPLLEWHSFANVPSPDREGYRLTISRAGDWTGSFIDDAPKHVWVKGIPTAGVGNIDKLFRRVVWVATGSGIGPTLPHLLSQSTPAMLVWSTRTPRETYGDKLVDEILAVQPDAMIWDTVKQGKPDMLKLAWLACLRFEAEAVICIANQKLTRTVVFGMESRGIPAYGAIWDS